MARGGLQMCCNVRLVYQRGFFYLISYQISRNLSSERVLTLLLTRPGMKCWWIFGAISCPPVTKFARATNLTNQRTTNILYPMLAAALIYFFFLLLCNFILIVFWENTTIAIIFKNDFYPIKISIDKIYSHWYCSIFKFKK